MKAHVAELADAYGSGPYGATRGGSSPLVSTTLGSIFVVVPLPLLWVGLGTGHHMRTPPPSPHDNRC